MFFYYLDLAWRSIKKTPFLSLLMVLAISIGIGITITTLNVYQLMSENPAGDRSDKLMAVQLWSQGKDAWKEFNAQVTYQDAYNLRKSDVPVRQTAMFVTGLALQTEDPDFVPLLESVRVTDSDFFDMFSVPFLYGKAWDKGVDTEAAYQVVINEALNKQLFSGEDSIGKTLYLDSKPYQIVGVTKIWNPSPIYYDLTTGGFKDSTQLFVPFSLAPLEEYQSWGNNQSWKRESMNNYSQRLSSEMHWVQFWAEVKDDKQRDEYAQWLQRYVEQQQLLGRFESPEAAAQLSNVEQWLALNEVVPEDNKILVGLSVLFLVVCLVNMLGLLLAKFLKRAPEVGVRRAIGASRSQIFSQHMVEVGLIGFGGGLLGLLWAWGSLSMLSAHFDLEDSLTQLDLMMWVLAPSIAILAALIAGVYPAWRICSTNPSVHLKSQ
ncbi:ABC transporter permease [Shewanella sp. D64]|uniref:ABC transporter permease n=1 Tax=unclassified Shewanella TaxID=196818 RepID=UPI0022BA338A|nr:MULTISPECIES: ABC transporter permease [unclassified Shewanella]MEC4724961.1 ABC transporter permease [Shewanella sp. D64]MEC4736862.1 ABC transporter permease [Shewanella sp. E94]WBJ96460.1 ABC transporter permease [Shewanella sp. MTB7]